MPETDLALSVAKAVEAMRKAGGWPSDDEMTKLAALIASAFQAKKDEVAILRLAPNGEMLRFMFPLRLMRIGAIPISSTRSLAAKTIRDKRGECVNNFSAYKHVTVFESVALSAEEKAKPIQKIMSAPMMVSGRVAGVIQVSRKAKLGDPPGRDFTPKDLIELTTAGAILGNYLATLPADPPPAKPPGRAKKG